MLKSNVCSHFKSLNIESNNISNASVLENLTNLESLSLKYNQISDISFLENLTNLRVLNLCFSCKQTLHPIL